jgi:hypothetical protein
MENSKQEDLLQRATKLAGNEDMAKRLIADAASVSESFSKEHAELVKRYVSLFYTKIDAVTNGLPKETQGELSNLISRFSIEEMISVFLINSSECSVLLQMRCSDFIYKAVSIWEMSAIQSALSQMKSNLMDMVMKLRPEPPKDHLS